MIDQPVPKRTVFPLTFEECVAAGGHCFDYTGMMLASSPPQYPQLCKHCGATRKAIPQDPYIFTDPVPR